MSDNTGVSPFGLDTELLEPMPARVLARRGFFGLWLRDMHLLKRRVVVVLARSVVNPLLFGFIFLHVLPRLNTDLVPQVGESFGLVLLPGLLAATMGFAAMMEVAQPMAIEFAFSHQFEDRLGAPLSWRLVALERLVFGAFQGLLAGIMCFPALVVLFPSGVPLDFDDAVWLPLVAFSACVLTSALGMILGLAVKLENVSLVFSVVPGPVIFLGCVYYPWSTLEDVRWLQTLVLFNPLTYVSEAFRATLAAPVPHMPGVTLAIVLGLASLALSWFAIERFRRRVREVLT